MPSPARTITERFLAYLAEENQMDLLPEIAQALQTEALRRQEITVISAETLTEKEQKELTESLTEKWGDHPLVFAVDAVLMSGMVIKFRDTIIDMSGKYRLSTLAHELH